jgi:hypothetical protein
MTTTSLDTGTTSATSALRLLVDDVLLAVAADDEADRYAGRAPAGRALVSLATLARRAAGALAADSGGTLDDAPGTAVRRELAAAARLLGEAAEGAHGEPWQIADLLVRAERLRAQLPDAGGVSGSPPRGR